MTVSVPVATSLAGGFLVAVAACGAFVWFYNRALALMHESVLKKVLALTVLPLGCLVGVLAAWRLAAGAGGAEGGAWRTAAAAGALVAVRMAVAGRRHAVLSRGSAMEARRPPFEALNAPGLKPWARAALWILRPLNGVGRLRIHRRRIPVPGLPREFHGYRIVHLTDWHIHKTLRPDWYRFLASETRRLRPDLVLYGGDFISKPEFVPAIPRFMRLLEAPDGVWFVRGNHDFWKSPQRIARLARAAGMRLLGNEGVALRRGGAEVGLVGIEAPWVPLTQADRDALDRLPRPRIALVHTPDVFGEAARLGCAVALAGHTHGGQVRLPLFGTTVSGCASGPHRASGIARIGDMLAITSNGQGAFFPLRFRCPPEVICLELACADER